MTDTTDAARILDGLPEYLQGKGFITHTEADAITALRAENAALRAQLAAARAEVARLDDAISHTSEQALASEIPAGYGPQDNGAWTKGYDAAIRHARRAKARDDAT